jgi:hypothetical protein
MAAMRLQLRAPGEQVSEEEERYRLLPAQLPVRNAVCLHTLNSATFQITLEITATWYVSRFLYLVSNNFLVLLVQTGQQCFGVNKLLALHLLTSVRYQDVGFEEHA